MADLESLQNAFLKADAAGDTEAAQLLATEIKRQRGADAPAAPKVNTDGTPEQPVEPPSMLQNLGNMAYSATPVGMAKGVYDAVTNPAEALKAADAGVRGFSNMISLGSIDHVAAMGNQLLGVDGEDALKHEREKDAAAEQEHPTAYRGGQLAGGFAVPEAKLLEGAGLVARAGNAAINGGAQLGALGFNNNDGTLADKIGAGVQDAGIGATVGAALPAALSTGHWASDFVRNLFKSKEAFAADKLAKAAVNAGTDINTAAAATADMRKTTPDWTLADQLGDQGGNLARMAANKGSPEAQSLFTQLADRQAGGPDRAKMHLADTVGDPASYHGTLDDATYGMKTKAAPLYEEAWNTPIDYAAHPELEQMFKDMPSAALSRANEGINSTFGPKPNQFILKEGSNGEFSREKVPNAQQWDYIHRALGDLIGASKGNGASGGLDSVGKNYADWKRNLGNQLDDAIPAYSQARSIFKGDAETKDALEIGGKAFSAHPEAISKLKTGFDTRGRRIDSGLSEAEGLAYGIGAARKAADDIDKGGLTEGSLKSVWNAPMRQAQWKAIIDDPAKFDDLSGRMKTETSMTRTFDKLRGNSTSIKQANDLMDAGQSPMSEAAVRLLTRGPWNAAFGMGMSYRPLLSGITSARSGEIAKALGSDGQELLKFNQDAAGKAARVQYIRQMANSLVPRAGRAVLNTARSP